MAKGRINSKQIEALKKIDKLFPGVEMQSYEMMIPDFGDEITAIAVFSSVGIIESKFTLKF